MKLKCRKDVFLFLILNFLYVTYVILRSSVYNVHYPSLFSIWRWLLILLALFKIMFYEKWNQQKILVYAVLTVITTIVFLTGGYKELILIILIIMAAYEIPFDKIVKTTFAAMIFSTVIVFLSYKAGILEDYIFVSNGGAVKVHSYGFIYYCYPGYICMTLSIILLKLKKDIKNYQLLILACLNIALYMLHRNKLSICATLIFIGFMLLMNRSGEFHFKNKIWRLVSFVFPFAILGVTVAGIFLFEAGKFSFTNSIFTTINTRMRYSVQALTTYGVHLFGNAVDMTGNTSRQYGTAKQTLYIDSGYIYSLIAYGIAFTILLLFVYAVLLNHLYKKDSVFCYMWVCTLLVACVVNDFMLSTVYFPVLFFIPEALVSHSKAYRSKNKRISTLYS